jgi:hypothetical protein
MAQKNSEIDGRVELIKNHSVFYDNRVGSFSMETYEQKTKVFVNFCYEIACDDKIYEQWHNMYVDRNGKQKIVLNIAERNIGYFPIDGVDIKYYYDDYDGL